MKPENLKKLEDTIKAMDSMYENQLKPYISISQQVGEAASFLVDRMNELIAIYNDEEDKYSVMCDGMNCKIRDTCKKYQEYLDYYIFDPLNGEDYLYYGFLEPAYNGTSCDNYVKANK